MTNSDLRNSIGKRIRDFRVKNDYTQAEFAEMVDISINFLSEIENGKKGMSQDTICKICQQFQFSADYLLFGISPSCENAANNSQTLLEIANTLSIKDLNIVIEYLTSLKKMKEHDFKESPRL